MLSVSEVSIERFKRASNVTFPVGEVNVIVGGNNSGKSSSIQGLHFFFTLLQSIELAEKWKRRLRTTIAPEELIYSPAHGLQPFVTEGTDVEDAYLNPQNLVEKNQALNELEAATLISESLAELKVDAMKNYVNGRLEALRKSGVTNPNVGEVADLAAKLIEADLRSAVKGKILLSKARKRFRDQRGVNLRVAGPSASLDNAALRAIRKLQKR